MKRFIAFILAFAMIFTVGCSSATGTSSDLMADITPNPVAATGTNDATPHAVADFGARLFAASAEEGENTLISPVSMLYVLAMITNGAEGETLEQLEDAFGCNIDALNIFLYKYMAEGKNTTAANAIWVREGFSANRDFLQTNADYFGRGVYTAPFDSGTVKDINDYVNLHTNGMIDKIIDRLDPSTVLRLVNALTFEDEWQDKYEKRNIEKRIFTAFDSTEQTVDFMHSTENSYIEDENTTGFVKRYKNGYRFVGLLPHEGVDIGRYIADFNGEKLAGLMESCISAQVITAIPTFESEYSRSMIEVMESIGVTDVFDPYKSDLSRMGESDTGLYISALLHKTYISVDEKGTKAAAISFATADECAAAEPAHVYTVKLDRPFVYMILPDNSDVPVFIGSVVKISG